MSSTIPQSASWYRALNLRERLSTVHAGPQAPVQTGGDSREFRLERWQAQSAFAERTDFEYRLQEDGIEPTTFRRMLCESGESLRTRIAEPLPWVEFINAAFTAYDASDVWQPPEALADLSLSRALVMVAPLVQHAQRQLRNELQRIVTEYGSCPVFKNSLEHLLIAPLPRRLLSILSRTVVLELHVQKMQGLLSGATADERFANFIDYLRQPQHALTLLQEYPVLARELVTCIVNWRNASAAFVADLSADWSAIATHFPQVAIAGALTALTCGAGDLHRGGRAVMLLTFASGQRLVYKPRSLNVDVHFQELLDWINARCDDPQFRLLRVLPRGDHGWVEFIERNTAVTNAQAQRYFRRQGGYLALLYVLEATDFHYENLISDGEHPMLIDLEALFQPRLQDERQNAADDVAGRELNYSVLRVGLLPQKLFSDDARDGLDVSGLGAQANQTTPFAIPQWEQAGTDDMHLVRRKGLFTGSPNRLQIDGVDVDANKYTDDIVAGFTRVYGILLAARTEFTAPSGPLQHFAGDEVRVLLRATRTYARVLQESFHPDVLRDALDRDCLFDCLWSRADHVPKFASVLAAERRELWNGDIPFFSAQPGVCDLRTGDGRVVAEFFSQSSLALAQQQIQRLCTEDCERQAWYIRASLATIALDDVERGKAPVIKRKRFGTNQSSPLALASAIGDRLAALAIRGRHDASWIGLTLVNNRGFDLSPLALDLYDGLPGVALFLAYLGELTGEARHTQLARAAVAAIRNQLPAVRKVETSIGFFNGYGGLLHVFTHLGVLWRDPSLLADARELVSAIAKLAESDCCLDVIGGAAGAIPALLNYYSVTGERDALTIAERCADHLQATAQVQAIGVGWIANVPARQPLSGFSHGAAGIASALFATAAATKRADLFSLAHAALDYERSLFAPAYGNWLDMRTSARDVADKSRAAAKQQHAWCHGAPGIGLARLASLNFCDSAVVRQEIVTAVDTTLSYGFGGTHCLCHGMLGNVELLINATQAPQFSARSDWRAKLQQVSAQIAADIATNGPLCANPAAIESPGLMTGLSGIGYGLLRLENNDAVPCILSLAPPRITMSALRSVA